MVKMCITALGISTVALTLSSVDSYAMENGMITASTLNIRSGPSTNNSIISKINKGQYVEILEKSNGWYKVKLTNGKIGWASSQYISIKSSSNSQTSEVINKKGKISANILNIRSGFGTNYSIISKVNNGTYVDILSKSSNGWYKVKLQNGLIGWASGSYIIEVDSSSQESSQIQNSTDIIKDKKAKVTATTLNIRSGAGVKYSVISKANRDMIVDLLEKSSNGWCKVKLPNGVIGWASDAYLSEVNNNSSNNNTENTPSISDDNSLEQENSNQSNKGDVVSYAYSLLGSPYEWGGSGPNSFDCSGFTQYVYKQAKGVNIPRVSREQAKYGQEVAKEDICPGDLVCFDTDKDGVINHVGIYLGKNEFIHCSGTPSNPDKVKVSSLLTPYWSSVLKGAKRF